MMDYELETVYLVLPSFDRWDLVDRFQSWTPPDVYRVSSTASWYRWIQVSQLWTTAVRGCIYRVLPTCRGRNVMDGRFSRSNIVFQCTTQILSLNWWVDDIDATPPSLLSRRRYPFWNDDPSASRGRTPIRFAPSSELEMRTRLKNRSDYRDSSILPSGPPSQTPSLYKTNKNVRSFSDRIDDGVESRLTFQMGNNREEQSGRVNEYRWIAFLDGRQAILVLLFHWKKKKFRAGGGGDFTKKKKSKNGGEFFSFLVQSTGPPLDQRRSHVVLMFFFCSSATAAASMLSLSVGVGFISMRRKKNKSLHWGETKIRRWRWWRRIRT